MGKLSITSFISLDGVMQSPGRADEDTTGGFAHGGWFMPLIDEAFDPYITGIFGRVDAYLLGRRTYDIFANHWPKVTDPNDLVAKNLNARHKYVVTSRGGLQWGPVSAVTGDLATSVAALKAQVKGELQVHGSARLASALLDAGLVDTLNVVIAPVILGQGKRLFGAKSAGAWTLVSTARSQTGLLLNRYDRNGEIVQGAAPEPL